MLGWLFGKKRKEETRVAEKPPVQNVKHREPVVILGVNNYRKGRGIYKKDRMHIAVFGSPGTGKSTFLLNLIMQNIKDCEGFMLIDPHNDLVKKAITHIPKDKWDRVVYISPRAPLQKCRIREA